MDITCISWSLTRQTVKKLPSIIIDINIIIITNITTLGVCPLIDDKNQSAKNLLAGVKKIVIHTPQQLITLPLILCMSLLCRIFHDFLDQP